MSVIQMLIILMENDSYKSLYHMKLISLLHDAHLVCLYSFNHKWIRFGQY